LAGNGTIAIDVLPEADTPWLLGAAELDVSWDISVVEVVCVCDAGGKSTFCTIKPTVTSTVESTTARIIRALIFRSRLLISDIVHGTGS